MITWRSVAVGSVAISPKKRFSQLLSGLDLDEVRYASGLGRAALADPLSQRGRVRELLDNARFAAQAQRADEVEAEPPSALPEHHSHGHTIPVAPV
nr:hypothetical protein [Fodinicola feengrottensis]